MDLVFLGDNGNLYIATRSETFSKAGDPPGWMTVVNGLVTTKESQCFFQ